jgi:hypothetical protein
VRPAAVAGERDQQPLGGDLLAAAEAEAGEPDRTLDDAKDRLDRLLAFLAAGFAILALQRMARMVAAKRSDGASDGDKAAWLLGAS